MVKLLLALVSLFLFIPFIPTPTAMAASCSFSFDPNPPNRNMDKLTVQVRSNDAVSGKYLLRIQRPNNNSLDRRELSFNGDVSVQFDKPPQGWISGNYQIYFKNQSKSGLPNQDADCTSSFDIRDPEQTSCEVGVDNQNIDVGTDVILNISGLKNNNDEGVGTDGYDVQVKDRSGNVFRRSEYKVSGQSGPDKFSLGGGFPNGNYSVEIKNRCGLAEAECIGRPAQLQCPIVAFRVVNRGQEGGGQISQGGSSGGGVPRITCDNATCSKAGGAKCDTKTGQKSDSGDGILTAIGCVPTDPVTLINRLMSFSIGIAGGIALLLMMYGSFEMVTSQGDPKALANGRERFVSALIGLLFILFSVVFLKIIGVDILGLDAISKGVFGR